MSEKDKIWSGKLKHTGIIDFPELYNFTYSWLVDEEYFVVEKSYNEKIIANGKDLEIKWEAKRKISDYFRFNLKLTWRVILTPVEVERNGKKIRAEQAKLEIKLEGVLEKDYEHRWETSSFLKFLRGVYDRYLIRGRIENYEKKLYGEIEEFRKEVKSFLVLSGISTADV